MHITKVYPETLREVNFYAMFTCKNCKAGFSISKKELVILNYPKHNPTCPFCNSGQTDLGANFDDGTLLPPPRSFDDWDKPVHNYRFQYGEDAGANEGAKPPP